MRIAIIGGGASGLYSAIALKKKHPDAEVMVFEKENKIARKLYATGNGHCNLLNAQLTAKSFNHPDFLAPFLGRYPFSALEETLHSWGVETRHDGDYVYPLSYSAATYVGLLLKIAQSLKIQFVLNARFLDYESKDGGFALKIDANPMPKSLFFDALIFATGGSSTSKLGSDGKCFSTFRLHDYPLVPLEPGLAPVKVSHPESIKSFAGFRHEANVRLTTATGKLLYQEEGEVLFKEDGLSGIVIFNVESEYLRLGKPQGARLVLDYFPVESEAVLFTRLSASHSKNPSFYFDAYFPSEVQPHFLLGNDLKVLAHRLKNDSFEIKGTYGFDSSQVSVGGIALSAVKENLESRKEKGVYFVGEVLDIDGFCGGFNLSWALLSALIVRDSL
jgi:flavoprotein, HI0933 family